jgi:hypothetical protein
MMDIAPLGAARGTVGALIELTLSELTLVLSKNARPEPKLIRVRGIRTIVKLWINIQRTQERGGACEVHEGEILGNRKVIPEYQKLDAGQKCF